MIINSFYSDVLKDYEHSLDIFFDAATGAVYEAGREDGSPGFLFTEVTGYALLDYLLLHAITGSAAYLDKARKSAEWIRDHAQDETGGVLTRYYFEQDEDPRFADKSFAGRRIYAFDTAICLRGMVALFNEVKDPSLLKSARRMGDFLTSYAMRDSGEIHAIYDARDVAALTPEPHRWSRCFGAFHTKVAEALVDLYTASGDEAYKSAATSICNLALRFQSASGSIETSAGLTELHPHCYATEGLLHVGRELKNDVFIKAARRATEWALSRCNKGSIAQSFDFTTGKPLTRFRTDALAQVLALASDLFQMGELDTRYVPMLDELATKILGMKTGPGGYFRYGYYEQEYMGKLESDTRSYWTNMFCMRGLYKYYVSWLMDNTCVALLAGGIGSRVWPISCESRPKPLSYSLLGDRSLLQETVRRYTHDYFIRPEQIYVLCSENALEEASSQVKGDGVPAGNCIIEDEPKGTIPAVALALEGLPATNSAGRMIIVTMADNVVSPYEVFQKAVTAALFTAREKECVVSVGKPVDKDAELDERFGHLIYSSAVDSYRTHQVDRFEEKPQRERFPAIRAQPGNIAWECGTVVFAQAVFENALPGKPESGNLAEDLLTRAEPWHSKAPSGLKLATSLLDPGVRFEDFGVPGLNLRKFYAGDDRYDLGNGNICIGAPGKVRMLSCSNTLVIADQLPVELYGLDGMVVIDNEVTNTAVIMPLEDVHRLPGLYRLFAGSKAYEPFISGGAKAREAEPTTFVEKSPDTRAESGMGLVFAYNIRQSISISRKPDGLRIVDDLRPELETGDFNNLLQRQVEDPRLVEHLVHVGALAKSFVGGNVVLSCEAREVLNKLCLYHAFGGCLTEEGERNEEAVIASFESESKLDRRMIDSRIIQEIVQESGRRVSGDNQSTEMSLLNANVNSAVEFIRKCSRDNPDRRDVIVSLMQAQNSAPLYLAFRKDIGAMALGELEHQIDRVFAVFKVAQIVSNGRWWWKRSNARSSGNRFLEHNRGPLEEFPFVVRFVVEWLLSVGMNPRIYVNRLHELLLRETTFARIVDGLSGEHEPLLCDRIYANLIGTQDLPRERLVAMVSEGVAAVERDSSQAFQLTQLLEMPMTLRFIREHSDTISRASVDVLLDVVTEVYHKDWKLIKPHVRPATISNLLNDEYEVGLAPRLVV